MVRLRVKLLRGGIKVISMSWVLCIIEIDQKGQMVKKGQMCQKAQMGQMVPKGKNCQFCQTGQRVN